jgi:hypothetical protein
MEQILKRELRQRVNHYELFGDTPSLIMASMILTVLLNKDTEQEEVELSYVNID